MERRGVSSTSSTSATSTPPIDYEAALKLRASMDGPTGSMGGSRDNIKEKDDRYSLDIEDASIASVKMRKFEAKKVLLHPVAPDTTVSGLSILFDIPREIIKRENKLSQDDHLQLLTHVKIPIEYCRISTTVLDAINQGMIVTIPASGSSSSVDLNNLINEANNNNSNTNTNGIPTSPTFTTYLPNGIPKGVTSGSGVNGTIGIHEDEEGEEDEGEDAALLRAAGITIPPTSEGSLSKLGQEGWDEYLGEAKAKAQRGKKGGKSKWQSVGAWENLRRMEEGQSGAVGEVGRGSSSTSLLGRDGAAGSDGDGSVWGEFVKVFVAPYGWVKSMF
ncbi:hypothetical protein HDU76_006245, partial [Blyttiomyces sp. JEL0837]